MEKNTFLVPLPDSGKSSDTNNAQVKAKNVPSPLTIKNILNYSRALRIEKPSEEIGFIEYIAN